MDGLTIGLAATAAILGTGSLWLGWRARGDAAEAAAAAGRSAAAAELSAAAAERTARAVERSAEVATAVREIEESREHARLMPQLTFSVVHDALDDEYLLVAESQGPLTYKPVQVRLEAAQGCPFPLEGTDFLAPYGEASVRVTDWTISVLRPGDRPRIRVPRPTADGGRMIVRYTCTADRERVWDGSWPLAVRRRRTDVAS